MAPFTSSGDRARWRIIYDLLRACEIGDMFTYEDMANALGLHAEHDRHTLQMTMRRAAKEYLEQEKRALEVVRNEGYRVTEAMERPRLVHKQNVKLKRALTHGHNLATFVDYSGLDMEARRILEATAASLYGQMQVTKALLHRQARLDKAMENVSIKQERNDSELQEMRERMADLERKLNERPA